MKIKTEILKKTKNQLDISNVHLFPKFVEFMKGYNKVLKSEGKAEVDHHQVIPMKSEIRIQEYLAYLHQFLVHQDRYDFSKIPEGQLDKLHYHAQYGAYYIIVTFTIRRGKENIAGLTKGHFKKFMDEETGNSYWKKVKGELSRNHR